MSSTSAITQVPMLNNANYPTWEISMKAFLCLQGPNGEGSVEQTENITTAEQCKEQAEWDCFDDITLDTSEETWDEIYETYGKPGAAGKFTIFCKAITFTISNNSDPISPISSLMGLFSCLADEDIQFTDPIKAMIILAALPSIWDSFCATILAQSTVLIPAKIIPSIADEHCQQKSSNSLALATQITWVQQPNDNTSNWHTQKKPKGPKNAPNGQQPSQENPPANGNKSRGMHMNLPPKT
ncbi:hypothetical protein GYMLUDRAFT_248079 [Collybiopsis luxurians FD-317 M1]|uniref:DUF4219 domain-containing protein n=1 Tax=Collybiopsis luxurians FD-317 M1 TaxID=944289 RepID=A0A0D0CDG2_9AGAR|nr:hypothetical protein GYMLUDRAFT_248079 [Collybiopsis luxurians FD-317 M1]